MERRQYPRVYANIPGEITTADGRKIDVVVYDTSSSGLRIQCGVGERNLITPKGQCTDGGHRIEVTIELVLSSGTGQPVNKAIARCALAFSERLAMNKFQIGMSYLDIDEQSFQNLTEFISTRIKQGT